jgi:hypothetical protein
VVADPRRGFVFSGGDDKRIVVWNLGTQRVSSSSLDPRREEEQLAPLHIVDLDFAVRDLLVLQGGRGRQLVCATTDGVSVWGYDRSSTTPEDSKMGDSGDEDGVGGGGGGGGLEECKESSSESPSLLLLLQELSNLLGEDEGEPSKLGSVIEVTPSGTVALGLLVGSTTGIIVKATLPMPCD